MIMLAAAKLLEFHGDMMEGMLIQKGKEDLGFGHLIQVVQKAFLLNA